MSCQPANMFGLDEQMLFERHTHSPCRPGQLIETQLFGETLPSGPLLLRSRLLLRYSPSRLSTQSTLLYFFFFPSQIDRM